MTTPLLVSLGRCTMCHRPLFVGTSPHYDAADPTKPFCSRHCYYRYYIQQGPQSDFDIEFLFPCFEFAQVPPKVQVRVLEALDDWETRTNDQYQQKVHWHDCFFTTILQQYHLKKWQHVLVVLLSESHEFF